MSVVGADPEFAIVDVAGSAVPAHRWFPPKGRDHIFRDGFMVELNPSPSTCRALMEEDLKALFKEASVRLPTGFRLVAAPVVAVAPGLLDDAPPDVAEFGCDPARNVYLGRDVTPGLDRRHPFRYAGGHLHLQTDGYRWAANRADRDLFIKMVDRWAGIPLAALLSDRNEYLRRRYYGRAGEMRDQTYAYGATGIEWRVPSSAIWNHTALVSLCTGVMREIAENFSWYATRWDPRLEPLVQQAINTGRGLHRLMTDLPRRHLYTREAVLDLARRRVFHIFALPYLGVDAHSGWGEVCAMFGHRVGGANA